MIDLVKRYEGKDFQVLCLTYFLGAVAPFEGPSIKASSEEEEVELLRQYREDFGMLWPVVVSRGKINNEAYGEMGVPMTVIIDKRGVIRRITTGFDPTMGKEIELIDKLLAE